MITGADPLRRARFVEGPDGIGAVELLRGEAVEARMERAPERVVPTEVLDAYVGEWPLPGGGGVLQFVREGTALVVLDPSGARNVMPPVSETRFLLPFLGPGAEVEFVMEGETAVEMVVRIPGGPEFRLTRAP